MSLVNHAQTVILPKTLGLANRMNSLGWSQHHPSLRPSISPGKLDGVRNGSYVWSPSEELPAASSAILARQPHNYLMKTG